MHRLHDVLEKVQSHHADASLDLLRKAYVFAAKVHQDQTLRSGDPYLSHSLAVAEILADLHMDEVTVACGLLHDVAEMAAAPPEALREHFGEEIAGIVDSLSRLAQVTYSSRKQEQAESFRRLILGMANDVRVVIVKLADRLHNMRILGEAPRAQQVPLAQETLDVYAPLANRLGIHRLKSELQDLGLRYTMPDVYEDLERKAEQRLTEREQYLAEVQEILVGILAESELEGSVSGRPKHIYSLYRKMQEQDIGFDQVYDLIAFRIILREVRDCYAALGAIHARWTPVPGRFKDYIALPKPNLYQSLHTTVIGPRGQPMEVQIRTEDMHRIAEEGIAAHWRYKEKRAAGADDRVFHWLRQLVEAHKDIGDAQEFLESVKVDLYPDLVFVFTPAGELVELPRGATPVDFAYAVHSQVGEQCVGAKVNGRMVPLSHRLKNGDRVEITTSKHHTPSADWLEFVQTSKARNKIRQWVKTQQRQRSVELGRDLCDREFRKAGRSLAKALKSGEFEAAAQRFGFNRDEELLEAVGYGRTSARQVLGKVYPDLEEREVAEPKKPRRAAQAAEGHRHPGSRRRDGAVREVLQSAAGGGGRGVRHPGPRVGRPHRRLPQHAQARRGAARRRGVGTGRGHRAPGEDPGVLPGPEGDPGGDHAGAGPVRRQRGEGGRAHLVRGRGRVQLRDPGRGPRPAPEDPGRDPGAARREPGHAGEDLTLSRGASSHPTEEA